MPFGLRIVNHPFIRRSDSLRSFFTAAWLGWQIESNWADPFLFAIYSIARPISGVMILVLMYNVITNGATGEPIFAYIYLGNALYIMVGMVITGVSWTIIDDREHYRVAKHTDGKVSRTEVKPLTSKERVEELSRMLGGVEVTARTRAHAAEMIDRAAR